MERNKIEQEFSEKLDGREIKPNANAWDRLDAMLTVAEKTAGANVKQLSKRDNGWIYIAASVVGFILMISFFLFKSEEAIDAPRTVVIENKAIKSDKAPATQSLSGLPQINNTTVAEAVAPKEHHPSKSSKSLSIIVQKPSGAINQQVPSPSLPDQQQVAQASNQNRYPATNTDGFQAAAPDQKTLNQVKVSATALLSEVDGELETSFREKVIRTIGKNYQTAKVALANRNTSNE